MRNSLRAVSILYSCTFSVSYQQKFALFPRSVIGKPPIFRETSDWAVAFAAISENLRRLEIIATNALIKKSIMASVDIRNSANIGCRAETGQNPALSAYFSIQISSFGTRLINHHLEPSSLRASDEYASCSCLRRSSSDIRSRRRSERRRKNIHQVIGTPPFQNNRLSGRISKLSCSKPTPVKLSCSDCVESSLIPIVCCAHMFVFSYPRDLVDQKALR